MAAMDKMQKHLGMCGGFYIQNVHGAAMHDQGPLGDPLQKMKNSNDLPSPSEHQQKHQTKPKRLMLDNHK